MIKKAKRLRKQYDALPDYSSRRAGLMKVITNLDEKITMLQKQELEEAGQLTIL
ncbi:MAG: hypothetical protein QM449_11065 [Synergistota bacterium]|nr:hypothetical protein [Synergistota bacterium]